MEYLKELVNHLGIGEEDLQKLEKGEIKADEFAQTFLSGYAENTVKPRIVDELKKTIEPEAFARAYGKNESLLIQEFGLDAKEFEGVEKSQRTTAILKKVKELQAERLKALESGDNKLVAQLTEQLEMANKKIEETSKTWEQKYNERENQIQQEKQKVVYLKTLSGLIDGVENARIDKFLMESAFEKELREGGYDLEYTDNDIWLKKDGGRVPNPSAPSKNLTVASFFEIVSKKHTFVKQSNGGSGGESIKYTDKDGKLMMHPNRLEYLAGKK